MLSSEPQFVTCRPFESPDGPPVDVGFTTFFSLKQGLTIQPRLAWNSLRRPGYSQTHRDLPVRSECWDKRKACATITYGR